MEVAELVDPNERHVAVVVVHHRRSLEIADREHLGLEIDGSPAQFALGIVEVAVQRPGVDDRGVRALGDQLVAYIEPVGVQANVDLLVACHVFEPRGVTVDRQPLVGVVEVAVVEGVAHRQPGDVARGQFLRIGLPLLGRVVPDERLVERTSDQRDRLLLEILRVLGVELTGLILDQGPRLGRGEELSEELRDQPQAHRELVRLTVVQREDAVLVAGEVGELVDVVPHALVGRVEQVRTVLVNLDTRLGLGFRVRVAAQVVPPVENENTLAQLGRRPFCHGQTEEPGSDDDEVVAAGRGGVGRGGLGAYSSHGQPGYPTIVTAPPRQASPGRSGVNPAGVGAGRYPSPSRVPL
ncbi:unannotated protein [freshwater metagenome]|uniref:Unannotated protein n=1 Tax=freshwater metagenome TaxID=449393 RepID=A0A6J7H691_9ZZZZ